MQLSKLCIAGGLLLCEVGIASAQRTFPATVVSSSTETVMAPADPAHCTFWDYDAYCSNSSPVTVQENIITVEQSDGRTLQLACTVDRQDRSCEQLPVRGSVALSSARGGYEVKFEDECHQQRKQFYALLHPGDTAR